MRFAALIVALAAAPAALAAPVVPSAAETPKSALPFIDDDYATALRQAIQKKRPIFVEAWAPW